MGVVYWITGLAGAGKTTIGKLLYEKIKEEYPNTVFLDGDTLRKVFGDDKAVCGQFRICRFRIVGFVADVVGRVLIFFQKPGDHGLLGEGGDQLHPVTVFCEKADIHLADLIADGVLFDMVAEDFKGLFCFFDFFD